MGQNQKSESRLHMLQNNSVYLRVIFKPILLLPNACPKMDAAASPTAINIKLKTAISFGKKYMTGTETMNAHVAPVILPSSSCFRIMKLNNLLNNFLTISILNLAASVRKNTKESAIIIIVITTRSCTIVK